MLEVPWVIFDLETTGFSKDADRVIELGGAKYLGGEEVGQFSELVSVDRPIPREVQKITGIDPSMLKGKPTIAEVIPQFIEFIEGSILVCHNSAFDMMMMEAELRRLNICLEYPCVCTLKMSRALLSSLPSRKLVSLAEHYEIPYDTLHRSLDDSRITAQVLLAMLKTELPTSSQTSFGDLKPFYHSS